METFAAAAWAEATSKDAHREPLGIKSYHRTVSTVATCGGLGKWKGLRGITWKEKKMTRSVHCSSARRLTCKEKCREEEVTRSHGGVCNEADTDRKQYNGH